MSNDKENTVIDTCDHGHRFAKLPGHPVQAGGQARCPHCMAMGLDQARQARDAALEREQALRDEIKGPDGFATWKDAAIDERVCRVAAEKREQAMAAHVERMRYSIEQWNDGFVSDADMMTLLFKWHASPADGSLTRRDLTKQAEALERLIQVMRQPMHEGGQPWLIRVEDAQAMADELRQQSEEVSQ